MNITKRELAASVASHTQMTVLDTIETISLLLEEIKGALLQGVNVELRGFGTFYTEVGKERIARLVRQNQPIRLARTKRIKFKATKELRDKIAQ